MSTPIVWKNCLESMTSYISPQHFNTWFKPIRVVEENEESLELEVPNRFFLEWIKEHYLHLIQEIIRKSTKKEYELLWRISEDNIIKSDSSTKKTTSKTKRAPAKVSVSTKRANQSVTSVGLCSRYNFDNFVIGKANEFAHAACFAMANQPSTKYNPLFIYGDVGLGKTHLLHAIGLKSLEKNPQSRVCYYTSEKFMNEFINFVSRQKMSDFRKKFRNVDLLLIDDIQFWSGKERTQEEFFHTFNALYESHKQIVVTSDKYPKDIDGIEERLRSRFEWGLVADIQPPDTETRVAILRKKSEAHGFILPDDVAHWLASVSGTNIRELEGYLNRIFAVSSLTAKDITLEMSKEALNKIIKETKHQIISIESIQKSVATLYNIKVSDLKSKRRYQNIAIPRQVAMFLCRKYGNFSFPEIGNRFGGKDHSTAIHAFKKVEKGLQENPELKRTVKALKHKLGVN